MKTSDVDRVKVTWVYDNRAYVYEMVPETFAKNEKLGTIKFELKELDGEDSNLEIVIQRKGWNTYSFKTDYYEKPTEELALKIFESEDELILFYDGKYGIAYFHLLAADT